MKNKLEIEKSHQGRVSHLILNSPENLNAMDLEMAEAFRRVKEQLQSEVHCRAVVVSGRGRAFSAGGDLVMLKEKARKPVEVNEREMMEFYLSFLGLRDLAIPIVCALHGHVVGAGFCFAASCDVRVADDSVLLAAPFTRLALHPGMGGSYFLPRAFGSEVARELMLTGRRMGAEEAMRHGFLSQVCSPEELPAAVDKLLLQILKSAPEATRALLVNEREMESARLKAALEREAAEQARCYARQEFLDGVDALLQKRSPPWSR
jgi:enoyl-CoA hydratase/carnithine racemase